jgi:lysophospholipase L1-like esterase
MALIIKLFLYVLLLIGIYLVLELGLFGYKLYYLKKPQAPDQANQSLGNGPSLRYIAAGDSTAVGVGATEVKYSYTGEILNYLQKSHSVTYKNIGVTGNKTTDFVNNQLEQIINFQPDIITISISANDATHLVSQSVILENYKTIISELKQKTNAKIFITNIPVFSHADILPWFYRKLIEYRSSKINPKILNLEDDRVNIINIHDFGWDSFPDISKTFAIDHFHPNNLGYQNWANAFLDKINKNY